MNKKLTAGKACKLVGLNGVDHLSKLADDKPKSTIYDLFNHNRLEFNLLVYGAVLKRAYEALNITSDK